MELQIQMLFLCVVIAVLDSRQMNAKRWCCGAYVDISALRDEELHHVCLTEVGSVVQRLPSTFQGPVCIFGLDRERERTPAHYDKAE